jgi:segregation and condensation protein B
METDTGSQASKNGAGLAARAEAFLFAEGEPMSRSRLMKLISCTEEELSYALSELSKRQEGGGITLIQTDKEISLAVSPSCAPAVRTENEREHEREIGDAGLEVLAILLYRGPSTRSQIDYIRGVNTGTTLRTLLSRSLVLRTENPNDSREYLYRPTAELLAHLGASGVISLPDYEKISQELATFESNKEQGDAQL